MVYGAKQSRQRLRGVLPYVCVGLFSAAGPVAIAARSDAPGPEKIKVQSVPVARGVGSEVRTVVRASPERVAQVLSDPASLPLLMGTAEARVLPEEQKGQLLMALMRREPWPAGEVRWVERVQQRVEGEERVVLWDLVRSDFFRQLRSEWRLRPERGPDGGEQCLVSYRLVFELSRWVPAFLVRRSNQDAMVLTVDRLRRLSEPRGVLRPLPERQPEPGGGPSLGAAVRRAAP